MKTIQVIELDGRPAALVAGNQAIIADHLTGTARAHIQAKTHYALRILAGQLPGPYTDVAAERYARSAATLRAVTNTCRHLRARRDHPRRPGAR